MFVITIILILSASLLTAGGENPVDFLELTIPVENKAEGRTYAASSAGASAVWLNPAGLGSGYDWEYSIAGMKGFENLNAFSGSVLVPLKTSGNIGLGLSYISSSEENFENYLGEEITTQKLNFKNIILGAGHGIRARNFLAGISLKFIKSELGMDNEILILQNIGVRYKFNFLKLNKGSEKNFALGLFLKDISILNYKDSGFCEFRTGLDYQIVIAKSVDINFFSDIWSYAGKTIGISFGNRLRLFKIISFYSGFSPSLVNKLTFGIGVGLKLSKWNIKIDYCINPAIAEGVPVSHYFGLTINSLTKALRSKAEEHYRLAEDFIKKGDYESAKKELDEIRKIFPEDKKVSHLTAEINKKEK